MTNKITKEIISEYAKIDSKQQRGFRETSLKVTRKRSPCHKNNKTRKQWRTRVDWQREPHSLKLMWFGMKNGVRASLVVVAYIDSLENLVIN